MSQNQKMLKIMSFITLIAAFGMAAYAAMSIAFANTSPGLLLAICVIVQCFLDAALGRMGHRRRQQAGAQRRDAVCGAQLAGACAQRGRGVVVTVLIGGFPWAPIVNAIIVAAYFFYARNVRQEALD